MSETMDVDDIGNPPGDEDCPEYVPTDFKRGGGKGGAGYLWFACADSTRDRVLPLANLREMEPMAEESEFSVLHFSGMDVVLMGAGCRRVAWRIFLGRCSSVHEVRPGQQPKKPGDPIIRRIEFWVPPRPDGPPRVKTPQHEEETRRRAETQRPASNAE